MKTSFIKLFVLTALFMSAVFAGGVQAEAAATSFQQSEIIVNVIGGRIRSEPNLTAKILKEMKVGSRLPLVEENGGWYKVEVAQPDEAETGAYGWISKTISTKLTDSDPGPIFAEIAEKYFQRESMNFQTAESLMEFLESAADDSKTYEIGGNLRLKRLLALSIAISKIGFDQSEQPPFKAFLSKYRDDVIYHEPAGIWIVRSSKFWELHQRYQKFEIGEEIAWEASKNPLPGECEGYIVCHLNYLRVTGGEYLNFYPNGKYTRLALKDLENSLQPMVDDLPQKVSYTTASDISDRADFNKILTEMRTIISKTPYIEKNEVLTQIDKIAEGFR
ncbi:MAG: SH3 domain-containing protein [Pyrinomonadaceae bacterium]